MLKTDCPVKQHKTSCTILEAKHNLKLNLVFKKIQFESHMILML